MFSKVHNDFLKCLIQERQRDIFTFKTLESDELLRLADFSSMFVA